MCNPPRDEDAASTGKPVAGDVPPAEAQPDSKKGRLWTQVVACVAASLGALQSATIFGWTAGTLPSMQADPGIHLNTAETAWMVGIVSLGALVGSPVAGRAMDRFGRRTTIGLASPVAAVGWLLIALGPCVWVILLGRAICGLMAPFLFSTTSVYNSEVPEARLRGRLGTLLSFFGILGIVLTYVAGAFLPWRYSCFMCGAPAVITACVMYAMPESPYWLMLKGRRIQAKAALRWLRGPHYDISTELENIDGKLKTVGTKVQYRELLRPRTRRPFFIALFFMTLHQLCGGNILIMYTGSIMISAGVQDPNMAVVYAGLVQLVGCIASVLLMDKLGRRLIIVASASVMGLFTVMLGLYYYMQGVKDPWGPAWLPLAAVLVAVMSYSFGGRTIPWLVNAELFNTTIRSTANTVCLLYNSLLSFAVVQTYPFAVAATGAHSVFFFLGGVSLVGSVLSSVILPETKGKTLEEIQDYFEKKTLKTSEGKDKKDASQEKEKTSSSGDESLVSSVPAVTFPTPEAATGVMTIAASSAVSLTTPTFSLRNTSQNTRRAD